MNTIKNMPGICFIVLGIESLFYKHMHMHTSSSPRSHCFIEHLGSISHFKTLGTAHLALASAVCMKWVHWTADLTVDSLLISPGKGATANHARDKSWHTDIEQVRCRGWPVFVRVGEK